MRVLHRRGAFGRRESLTPFSAGERDAGGDVPRVSFDYASPVRAAPPRLVGCKTRRYGAPNWVTLSRLANSITSFHEAATRRQLGIARALWVRWRAPAHTPVHSARPALHEAGAPGAGPLLRLPGRVLPNARAAREVASAGDANLTS